MRVVSIVGYSGTGKTRLIVRLIEELRGRGLRVAAVKRCSHGFTLDTEGKDTAEFGRAGAFGVAMVSPDGWAAIGRPAPTAAAALGARLFPGADVVLIEGGKNETGGPRIEVLRGGVSTALTGRPEGLLAVVSDVPPPDGLPRPAFGPEETSLVADLILSLEEDNMADIRLEVDGREVNLNAFVRTFIERTVLGMVTSLSGIEAEPRRISLVIDRGGEAAGGPGGEP